MPGRRREVAIDLQDSDGSDADSYDSAEDSEGSLRDFVVDDDVIECSDYDDEDTGSDFEEVESDDDISLPEPTPRRLRSRRAASSRYVLPADMDEDDENDSDYDPGDEEVCAVFEIDVNSQTLSHLNQGAQRFLEE